MFDESPFDIERFSGTARLFPLPNLVLFPHVMQPLHIFEPRYVAMLEEALGSDGLIALATLKPNWEAKYEGRPPIYESACLCRVMTYQKTEQGTYNVLVVGIARVKVDEELAPTKLFREARVSVQKDLYPDHLEGARSELQKRLLRTFKKILPRIAEAPDQLDQLLGQQISLGMLTDIISFTVDLDIEFKIELLAESLVDERAAALHRFFSNEIELGESTPQNNLKKSKPFPPDFSPN